MTVRTASAGMTKASHPTMFQPEDVRVVQVNGQPRGYYARNKHGVVIGTTNLTAAPGENPFLDLSKHVRPAGRHVNRKTADVVRDIAEGVVR